VHRKTRPEWHHRFGVWRSRRWPPAPLFLGELPPGARAVVRSLHGGRGFCARVAALGVTPGVEVTVIQNQRRGPMLIEVRDTRVALGRGEAFRIEVEQDAAGAGE
jgi:ferrous iron transport protein A